MRRHWQDGSRADAGDGRSYPVPPRGVAAGRAADRRADDASGICGGLVTDPRGDHCMPTDRDLPNTHDDDIDDNIEEDNDPTVEFVERDDIDDNIEEDNDPTVEFVERDEDAIAIDDPSR